MVKSMTGYGRGETETDDKRVTVEIKSVNHRFCEVVIRMPKYYIALEDRVRRIIQSKIARGRLDVFITIDDFGKGNKTVRVDKALAMSYYSALGELGKALDIDAKPSIIDIARLPEVVTVEEAQEDSEALWPLLCETVDKALTSLIEMRTTEGSRLRDDLFKRVSLLTEFTDHISKLAPSVVTNYKNRLQARLRELMEDIEIDEQRLAAEVAIFADRSNITEELVRLRSHFDEIFKTLNSNEAVGRKLDFLIQELNREFNTIGSKANDTEISSMVIKAKSEVEKIREQVQNIE